MRFAVSLLLSASLAAGPVWMTYGAEASTEPLTGASTEAEEQTEEEQQAGTVSDRDAAYLAEYYNLNFGDEITPDTFSQAITALGSEPEKLSGTVTWADAIRGAVRVADMEELALTYTKEDAPDKASEKLDQAGVNKDDFNEEDLPYIACALDLGLVTPEDLEQPLTGQSTADLLYQAAEMGGKGRNYVGRISDSDILGQVRSALSSFSLMENPELVKLGKEIVLQGATTGYGLKYSGYDARFMDEYSLKYGHSDYVHAAQLIGLLKSEGYDGYVQIEPKMSVYEYLMDWGKPADPTPTYEVKEEEKGRYLCYATEYDMMLEFDTLEQKEKFHDLIETYAKKYDDSLDADGNLIEPLLSGSWWQPLYSSHTEVDGFDTLYDNVIYDGTGMYSIHSFSTPDNREKIQKVVNAEAPDLKVSPEKIYVNPAFYRYITGSDHQ